MSAKRDIWAKQEEVTKRRMEKTTYHGASGLILFTEHYYGDDIRGNEMLGDMACFGENCIQDSLVET